MDHGCVHFHTQIYNDIVGRLGCSKQESFISAPGMPDSSLLEVGGAEEGVEKRPPIDFAWCIAPLPS